MFSQPWSYLITVLGPCACSSSAPDAEALMVRVHLLRKPIANIANDNPHLRIRVFMKVPASSHHCRRGRLGGLRDGESVRGRETCRLPPPYAFATSPRLEPVMNFCSEICGGVQCLPQYLAAPLFP